MTLLVIFIALTICIVGPIVFNLFTKSRATLTSGQQTQVNTQTQQNSWWKPWMGWVIGAFALIVLILVMWLLAPSVEGMLSTPELTTIKISPEELNKALETTSVVPVFKGMQTYNIIAWICFALILSMFEWWGCKRKFYRTVFLTPVLVLVGVYIYIHPSEIDMLVNWLLPKGSTLAAYSILLKTLVCIFLFTALYNTRLTFRFFRPLTWATLIFLFSFLRAFLFL